MQDNTSPIFVPIIILGGGVAGLWLLNRLRSAGHEAILLEQQALGQGQSIAAQGIVHGGLKYALGGQMTQASQAIADMPARWRQCLLGQGEIDLQPCRLLSPHYYMWSSANYRSRIKAFFGSKALHGRARALPLQHQPDFARQLQLGGSLYQLDDFVLDTQSLLTRLATLQASRLFRFEHLQLRQTGTQQRELMVEQAGQRLRLRCAHLLLCAGAGNAELLHSLGMEQVRMQRRPLHMVCVTHAGLPATYMHCIGSDLSLTPELTITSHPLSGDRQLWYLGGELAESGVNLAPDQQRQRSARLLARLFPQLAWEQADWYSFHIDRAEAATADGQRPTLGSLNRIDTGLSVAWPSKLTLCPALGDDSVRQLQDLPRLPLDAALLTRLRQYLPAPEPASLAWQGKL